MRTWMRLALVFALVLSLSLAAGCGSSEEPKEDAGGGTTAPKEGWAEGSGGEGSGGAAGQTSPAGEGAYQSDTPPAAPADVSGMLAWFAAAYPSAPWLERIKKVEYVAGEVPDSGGFANAIVITTDLDFASEQALGTEIANAVGESQITWAKQCVIAYADGKNIQAGDIFDPTP